MKFIEISKKITVTFNKKEGWEKIRDLLRDECIDEQHDNYTIDIKRNEIYELWAELKTEKEAETGIK